MALIAAGLNTRGGIVGRGLNEAAGALDRLFELLAIFDLAVRITTMQTGSRATSDSTMQTTTQHARDGEATTNPERDLAVWKEKPHE